MLLKISVKAEGTPTGWGGRAHDGHKTIASYFPEWLGRRICNLAWRVYRAFDIYGY